MKQAIIAALFVAISGTASNAAAQDQCSDVLRDGTVRTDRLTDNSYFRQINYSRLLSSSYDSAKRETGIGATVPVGDLLIGANFNQNDFTERRRQIDSTYFSQVNQTREIDVALTSGDPEILRAWSSCMNEKGGLAARFETITPTEVYLILEFRAQVGRAEERLTQDVALPAGVTVRAGESRDCITTGRVLKHREPCAVILSIADPWQTVSVIAHGEAGSATRWLPARIELFQETQPYVFNPPQRADFYNHQVGEIERSEVITLTPDQVRDRWMFDPSSASSTIHVTRINVTKNWCRNPIAEASYYTFKVGYRAYAPDRKHSADGDIQCHVTPTINLWRETWVAQTPRPFVRRPPTSLEVG